MNIKEQEEAKDLLVKIGISEDSARVLSSFLGTISLVNKGLLIKGLPGDVIKQVHDLAMLGYITANPKLKEEMETLLGNKDSLKKMLDMAAKAAVDNILKDMEISPAPVDEIDPETGKKDMSLSAVIKIKPNLH